MASSLVMALPKQQGGELRVRNTFLEVDTSSVDCSPSFRCEERLVRSCPSSGAGMLHDALRKMAYNTASDDEEAEALAVLDTSVDDTTSISWQASSSGSDVGGQQSPTMEHLPDVRLQDASSSCGELQLDDVSTPCSYIGISRTPTFADVGRGAFDSDEPSSGALRSRAVISLSDALGEPSTPTELFAAAGPSGCGFPAADLGFSGEMYSYHAPMQYMHDESYAFDQHQEAAYYYDCSGSYCAAAPAAAPLASEGAVMPIMSTTPPLAMPEMFASQSQEPQQMQQLDISDGSQSATVFAYQCAPEVVTGLMEPQCAEPFCAPLDGQAALPPAPSAPPAPPALPAQLPPAAASPAVAAPAPTSEPPPPPATHALGTPEMPSMGSAGHSVGSCKPCAFFHSNRCSNGLSCQFCHLCDAGEKKRRRKEKLELRRGLRRSDGGASGEDSAEEA